MSPVSTPTDRALISSLLDKLLSPVPKSELVAPAVISAINTSHHQAVKLLIGPSSVRQTIEQLQDLREKAIRHRRRRQDGEEGGKGRIIVPAELERGQGGQWARSLPKAWPGQAEENGGERDKDRQEYATLRNRVIALNAKLNHTRAQLAEYKSLATLAASITPQAVAAHDLVNPDSTLSRALTATAEILPQTNANLREREQTFVATRRRKLGANGRRGGAAPTKQIKVEGQSAGAALMGMV